MKLLTLNTHSLQETAHRQKLDWFVAGLLRERPDLIALQEVNQTRSAPIAAPSAAAGLVPLPGIRIPLRRDNYAAQVARQLRIAGVDCSWTWLPVKIGYGLYDEGLALLSTGRPIRALDAFPISRTEEYSNWRTRQVLGARLEGLDDWFYSVHMGWWDDPEEPFQAQWQQLNHTLRQKRAAGPVWLLGDFNSPAEVRGEGYDCILRSGWQDTHTLSGTSSPGFTVEGSIDGWQARLSAPPPAGMRIDQIWCSRSVPVIRSRVLFDGRHAPRVSDHFALLAEIGSH